MKAFIVSVTVKSNYIKHSELFLVKVAYDEIKMWTYESKLILSRYVAHSLVDE